MEKEKLILTTKKFKADTTTIISARVSIELIKEIDDLAKRTNRNRNEMIQILLSYAVENTIIKGDDE